MIHTVYYCVVSRVRRGLVSHPENRCSASIINSSSPLSGSSRWYVLYVYTESLVLLYTTVYRSTVLDNDEMGEAQARHCSTAQHCQYGRPEWHGWVGWWMLQPAAFLALSVSSAIFPCVFVSVRSAFRWGMMTSSRSGNQRNAARGTGTGTPAACSSRGREERDDFGDDR